MFKKGMAILMFLISIGVTHANEKISDGKRMQLINIKYENLKRSDPGKKEELYIEIDGVYNKLITEDMKKDYILCKAAEFYSDWGEEIKDKDKSLKVLKKGLKYVNNAIGLNKDNGMAYFYKGALIMQIGSRRGILSSLKSIKPMRDNLLKSIELNPNFSPAYHGLATLYMEAPGWPLSVGNKKKALSYRLKSVELSPNNFEYKLKLAYNYIELEKYGKSKKILRDIIGKDPVKTDKTDLEKFKEIKRKAKIELEKLERE